MEECLDFLGKKWLSRILSVSQMEECLHFLGKKWLIKTQSLMTHPKIKECKEEREADPPGRSTLLHYVVRPTQKGNTRGEVSL